MALAFQTSSSVFTGGVSVTIPAPTGIAVDDVLVCYLQNGGNTHTDIIPATGWSYDIDRAQVGDSAITYFKKAVAADTTAVSYVFSSGGGTLGGGVMLRYSGEDTTTSRDATSVTNGASNAGAVAPTIAGLTTVTDLAIAIWGATEDSSDALTKPANCTLRVNGGSAGAQLCVADRIISPAGATGAETASATIPTGDDWNVILMALRPAAGGAVAVPALPQMRHRLRQRGRPLRRPAILLGNSNTSQSLSQTLSASSASSASMQRGAAKIVSASSTSTASFAKAATKGVSAMSPTSATLNKQLPRTVVVASASAPVVTKQVTKPLTASSTSAATLARAASKLVTATSASVASFVKAATKTLSVSSASTATMLASRFFMRALSAVSASAATLIKQVNKPLSASSVTAASFIRNVGKILTLSSASSVSIVKAAAHTLTASSASMATILRTFSRTLSAAAASAAALSRAVSKTLTGSSASSASFVKAATKTLTAASPSAALMLASKFYTRLLSALSASAAVVTRQVGKPLGASSATAAAMSRQTGKRVTATAGSAVTIVKAATKTVVASSASSATLVALKVKLVAMTAVSVTTATLAKFVGKPVIASSAATATVSRSIVKLITASTASSVSFSKALARTLTATTATVSSLSTKIVRGIFLTASTASVASVRRAVSKSLAVGSPTTAQITKGLSRVLTVTSATVASVAKGWLRLLGTSSASVVALNRVIGKQLAAVSATGTTIGKAIGKGLNVVVTVVPTFRETTTQLYFTSLSAIARGVASIIARLFPAKTAPPPTLTDFATAQLAIVDLPAVAVDLSKAILADTPAAYWRLDDVTGPSAADTSGNNRAATINGGVTLGQPGLVANDPDKAMTFDGTGWLLLPASAFPTYPTLAQGSTSAYQLSFKCRFKTTSPGVIVAQDNGSQVPGTGPPNGNVPALYVGTDGLLRGSLFWLNSVALGFTSTKRVDDGLPHVVVLNYNNGTLELWLDGVLHATRSGLPQVGYSNTPYVYRLGVGAWNNWTAAIPATTWGFFIGTIDEVEVSWTPLSPAAIVNDASLGGMPQLGTAALVDQPIASLALIDQISVATGTSVAPQGNWVGTYGQDGYVLLGFPAGVTDTVNLPLASLATVGTRFDWISGTSDVRALQTPDRSTRHATCIYAASTFSITLTFPSAYNGTLHLYFLDWDAGSRAESVAITDASGTRTILMSGFATGKWLHIPIVVAAGGALSIVATLTGGTNVVMSGLFLGGASQPASAALADIPITTVTLLDFD